MADAHNYRPHPVIEGLRLRMLNGKITRTEFDIGGRWLTISAVARKYRLTITTLYARIQRTPADATGTLASLEYLLRPADAAMETGRCRQLAPGIEKAVYCSRWEYRVHYQDRDWTVGEIADQVGLGRDKICARIRQAVRDGKPIEWIFRLPSVNYTRPKRRQKHGMYRPAAPTRHEISPIWKAALGMTAPAHVAKCLRADAT